MTVNKLTYKWWIFYELIGNHNEL